MGGAELRWGKEEEEQVSRQIAKTPELYGGDRIEVSMTRALRARYPSIDFKPFGMHWQALSGNQTKFDDMPQIGNKLDIEVVMS